MSVLFSCDSFSSFFVLPFLCGRNPSKRNLSLGIPDWISAETNAVAPGKHSTGILFSIHALINKNPGSEIPGVPASLIIAIIVPFFNFSIIPFVFLC